MAPLDPWIIEEIIKREEEQRRERERQQPVVEKEPPGEPKPGHEMPSDRKPGYEMPNPNEPARPPAEKKEDDGQRRGVDISRITGNDDDDEKDDGSIRIDMDKLPPIEEDEERPKDEKQPE